MDSRTANSTRRASRALRRSWLSQGRSVSQQVPGLLIDGGHALSLSEPFNIDLHRLRDQIRELSRSGLDRNVASCLYRLRDAELTPGCCDAWVLFEQSRRRQDRLLASTSWPRSRWRAVTTRLPWRPRRQHWNSNRSRKEPSEFSFRLKGNRGTTLPRFGPSKGFKRN